MARVKSFIEGMIQSALSQERVEAIPEFFSSPIPCAHV